MPDFYSPSRGMPLADQADGLRRMFSGRRTQLLALVANPQVPYCTTVLDRLATTLALEDHHVLVVDASNAAPDAPELAQVDLAACIERLSPQIDYVAARGLPQAYVDTRGCAGAFIDALHRVCPQADVIVLHAEATDLVRVLKRRACRPVLLAADNPESLKHAYGSCKLLVQRSGLMTFDLLLAAPENTHRAEAIAQNLAGCAEQFLGALLRNHVVMDPLSDPGLDDVLPADNNLLQFLQAQLNLEPAGLQGSSAAVPPLEGAWRASGWAGYEPTPAFPAYR